MTAGWRGAGDRGGMEDPAAPAQPVHPAPAAPMPLFGRKDAAPADDEPEDEFEHISFQGPVSGDPPDMSAHAALARAGLNPARELISDALSRRAEMIRLETRGPAAAVRMFIDGVAYPGGRMPARQAAAVTQVLKLLCGLNVKLRDKKQSGALKGRPRRHAVRAADRDRPGAGADDGAD